MTESNNLPAIWSPSTFAGRDLLPIEALTNRQEAPVGLEDLEIQDIILPKLLCLQGMSQQVADGLPGAAPGKFYLSSTGEVMEGPIRAMLVYRHKSRAMYPDPKDPEKSQVEQCTAHDALIGTRYGDCHACAYSQWRNAKPKNKPPLCTEYHNFVLLTKNGPAMLRMGGTSFPAAKEFVSGLSTSRTGLWDYPVVISSIKAKNWAGYTVDIRLDRKDPTPSAIREAARRFYDELRSSFEKGKLSSQDEVASNSESSQGIDEERVPF